MKKIPGRDGTAAPYVVDTKFRDSRGPRKSEVFLTKVVGGEIFKWRRGIVGNPMGIVKLTIFGAKQVPGLKKIYIFHDQKTKAHTDRQLQKDVNMFQ